MDIKQLIGETTDYDQKVALETKKPKSWCKSLSFHLKKIKTRHLLLQKL